MTFFDVLTLIGGLALFLFGMGLMGAALEKRAGNRLKTILGSMTSSVFRGFLLGLGVTAVIQSSSATTVMVVGFVNSGIMTLHQAIGVIMGANIGTSVTAWILSLTGISGDSFFIRLLEPSSFVPVLALVGVILYLFQKNPKKQDTGLIFLGFAVLMFGMDTMSSAVAGLKNVPQFTQILTLFSNPILGILVGMLFTAIIQSSSASIGILQALSLTGSVTYATAIPIIMGQNIGTCVTALISAIGASKNAKRAAVVHICFNVITTVVVTILYYIARSLFLSEFLTEAATPLGIAIFHTSFNVFAVCILMPFTRQLERLSCLIVKDSKKDEQVELLDDRLLATPAVAVERCRTVAISMAELAVASVKQACGQLTDYSEKMSAQIREQEEKVDLFEDRLGTYMVKLSARAMTDADSADVNKMLHMIGDFERLSDHAVNILESAEEIHDKKLIFSNPARQEMNVMLDAVSEILDLALKSFRENDLDSAAMVEPLEQVVDTLKDGLKKQHIMRLQKQECTIELGFVLSDLLTNLERVADHCSNIAGCMLEMAQDSMGLDIHEYLDKVKTGQVKEFNDYYAYFSTKYDLAPVIASEEA